LRLPSLYLRSDTDLDEIGARGILRIIRLGGGGSFCGAHGGFALPSYMNPGLPTGKFANLFLFFLRAFF